MKIITDELINEKGTAKMEKAGNLKKKSLATSSGQPLTSLLFQAQKNIVGKVSHLLEKEYTDSKTGKNSQEVIVSTFNQAQNKMSGVYNDRAEVVITSKESTPFDFFSLTCDNRTDHMQEHLEVVKERMLDQLNLRETGFDDFNAPGTDN
jgi:hypothetical protein